MVESVDHQISVAENANFLYITSLRGTTAKLSTYHSTVRHQEQTGNW
jgi:hypothetical protein